MAEQFLIWSSSYVKGQCVISPPDGIKKGFQLRRGISRLDDWPDKVVCRMSKDFPKDLELADNLYGAALTVVSGRVKDALEAESVSGVEYLPVQIYNHKNRVASTDYFVVNPLSTVDCVDIKASGVEWNDINPELISSCDQLVIKNKAVPSTKLLFRPKHAPFVILVRAELAKELQKAKLSGLDFRDPLEYEGP